MQYIGFSVISWRIQFSSATCLPVLPPLLFVVFKVSLSRLLSNFGMFFRVLFNLRAISLSSFLIVSFSRFAYLFSVLKLIVFRLYSSAGLTKAAYAIFCVLVPNQQIIRCHLAAFSANSKTRQWDRVTNVISLTAALFSRFYIGALMTKVCRAAELRLVLNQILNGGFFTAPMANHSILANANSHVVSSQGSTSAAFSLIRLGYFSILPQNTYEE